VRRVAYLDNLKVLLVAGVIFGHAWAGYADLGSWAYTDAREVTLAPVTQSVLEALLGPFALFVMGFFFLVAGLLTPGSVARKGPGRFARDRMLRLGLPLLVFVLVLWPMVVYVKDRVAGRPAGPFWSAFARAVRAPDPAHLWFVEVLLLYSLGYAAWRWLRPSVVAPAPLRLWHVVALAAGIAVASFLIRLRFPLDSTQYADLHLWQWPQCLGLFALGVAGARRGWLDPVPAGLGRRCGIGALVGVAAIGGFVLLVGADRVPVAQFFGGWHWAALATAAAEGILAAMVSVWLLGVAQRHLDRSDGALRAAAGRGAYAAFLVQGHVLVGLALALRWAALPAEVKAAVVSVLGVLACFALGWILARRIAVL
jgi:hypothetical protein